VQILAKVAELLARLPSFSILFSEFSESDLPHPTKTWTDCVMISFGLIWTGAQARDQIKGLVQEHHNFGNPDFEKMQKKRIGQVWPWPKIVTICSKNCQYLLKIASNCRGFCQ